LATLEELGEVVSTDVLIVGGGVGGLVLAIKAKEANPQVDVTIVERQTAGYAGKATKIGGILAFLGPKNDGSKFLDFQVRTSGFFLNDQSLLKKYIETTYPIIQDFEKWGCTLASTPDGKTAIVDGWVPNWSSTFIDIDFMLPIRAQARKLGVKIINKVNVVDVLKKGNRVVGAVGFDMVTGKFYIFKAKATVLANGSCGYKVRRYWMAGTGDGVAAAFRAGALMRNAEFGNLYGHTVHQDTDSGMVGANFLVNSKGENLWKKYNPSGERTGVFLSSQMAAGMEKEMHEGRGPILNSPPPPPPGGFPGGGHGGMEMGRGLPKLAAWSKRMMEKEKKWVQTPMNQRPIAIPLHGETSCIKVDENAQTSVEGLWAIGDASYAGSAVAGAVASPPGVTPGSGIMYAAVSATWAGPSAAKYAASNAALEPDVAEVKRMKAEIFAPLEAKKGIAPMEAISMLQDVAAPLKYNLRRSKERLEEAIKKVQSAKEILPQLKAQDPHYLGKCHEVKSMTLCAELTFRAALERTETRGFHYREDFPKRDDANWLKWIILKGEGNKIKLSTQDIQINKYPVKP
jgi:succinate dehydrogenase / fumarate reductase, flavoprotein subunit